MWPVLYYEGEQNRYYNNVVKDLNLLKAIKLLEGIGLLDLVEAINYLTSDSAEAAVPDAVGNTEAPLHLMRQFAFI